MAANRNGGYQSEDEIYQDLLEYLKRLHREQFYGSIELKFKGGCIVSMRPTGVKNLEKGDRII